ncbi:MAG TPA: hemerythrin domain-containing protein [Candidatus Omnitrophota bacterium]|nr:hemerythrin domain-containing protein [Candidatus Omnitrophota bacterium]
MSKTASYRKHHEEIRDIVAKLRPQLTVAQVGSSPEAVAEVVRLLFGKFSIHLALEDNSLYPRCLSHADATVRAAAQRFQSEMGGLGQQFEDYKRAWPGPLAIARDPAEFIAQTKRVLDLLTARVEMEELHFYSVIDRAA